MFHNEKTEAQNGTSALQVHVFGNKLKLCTSAHINYFSIIQSHSDGKVIAHFLTIEYVTFTKKKWVPKRDSLLFSV